MECHDTVQDKRKEFEACIQEMRKVKFDIDCREPVIVLLKLVSNLIKNPGIEKFRTIKASNKTIQEQILKYDKFMDYLLVCGFAETSGSLVSSEQVFVLDSFSENKLVIEEGLRLLKKVGKEIELLPNAIPEIEKYGDKAAPSLDPNFNSFQSSVVSLNALPTRGNGNTVLEERVKQLKEERKRVMEEAGIPNRNIKVYPLLKNFNPRKFVETNDGSQIDSADRAMVSEATKKMMEKNASDKFLKTKAVREMESLKNKKLYTRTILRIQLPNRWIIEVSFSPLETLKTVLDVLLSEVFKPDSLDIHMTHFFTTPPRNVFPKENYGRSLEELKLVPASLFHLGFGEVDSKGKVVRHPPDLDYVSHINKDLIVQGELVKKSVVPKADKKVPKKKKRETTGAKTKKIFGILKF